MSAATASPPGVSGTPESDFLKWQADKRAQLSAMLGIPNQRVPLAPESRGQFEHDGIVVEKWIFTSEPGSRVPALLYRPIRTVGLMPAMVFTYGHGSSKSSWPYQYAGQLYARLGLACLAIDPIGEEERHAKGGLGTRAHDSPVADARAAKAGRLMMGKLVFDTLRAIDFLRTRTDIDRARIGVAGYSLGGAVAGWVAAVEPRIQLALVCGWAYDDITIRTKLCTRTPNERMREWLTWTQYASLPAPRCAVLVANGDADGVIDRDGDGSAWIGTRRVVEEAERIYAAQGAPGGLSAWFEPRGGHRPYFAYLVALEWIHRHLGTPGWTLERMRALPVLNAGEWCDRYGIELERLYGTQLHWRGATLPDLQLRPVPRERLAVLRTEEVGRPEYSLEGWLDHIERSASNRNQSDQ
ncbi:MAG: acetylxylan esterase [Verrucomicrobia bacterium]|nr:acetylxylan esterase [Verrucomicrobiota bacterium]